MLRVMVFIDGTWLYWRQRDLRKKIGDPKLTIDYGRLPRVLAKRLGEQLGVSEVDLVRTYIFGSVPKNVDPLDAEEAEEREDFYEMLKEEFHYETQIFEIDYKRRRLHAKDRDPRDTFIPKEKCVDVALASTILYLAALPYAYDAAIVVIGDEDYAPVLQYIRHLGKRVMIVSVRGACAPIYDPIQEPTDPKRVRDCDTIFLDDIIGEILYEPPLRQVECQSSLHAGDKKVWTRERIRKGRPFYCEKCRELYRKQRIEAEEMLREEYPEEKMRMLKEGFTAGRITRIFSNKGYGYIRSKDRRDYWFHASNVREIKFEQLTQSQLVQFKIKTEATAEKAGDVYEVYPL